VANLLVNFDIGFDNLRDLIPGFSPETAPYGEDHVGRLCLTWDTVLLAEVGERSRDSPMDEKGPLIRAGAAL